MNTPIFDGPSIFITLGFLLVLAGYLRQVSVSARELHDRIAGRHPSTLFPWAELEDPIRSEKLAFQEGMRKGLAGLTHGIFFLSAFIACRIVLFAATKFLTAWNSWNGTVQCIKIVADLIIASCLVTLIIAMWVMHWRNRKADSQLRDRAINARHPITVEQTNDAKPDGDQR